MLAARPGAPLIGRAPRSRRPAPVPDRPVAPAYVQLGDVLGKLTSLVVEAPTPPSSDREWTLAGSAAKIKKAKYSSLDFARYQPDEYPRGDPYGKLKGASAVMAMPGGAAVDAAAASS